MLVTTAWLEPVKAIGGQDHLGTLAPCEAVYTQLLPGITNNTNRARCYSFYPWLLWAIDRAGWPKDAKAIVRTVRRAECLICLIGIAHENDTDAWKHGAGLAGRAELVPAWQEIRDGATLRLSTFATTDDTDTRYWKHTLGGLGQYYLGTLRDLQLIDGNSQDGLRFTKERGAVLAEALAPSVDGALFLRTLEEDVVSKKTLQRLASFCPCSLLAHAQERDRLVDLFFNRPGPFFSEGDAPRRLTLTLVLDLAARLERGNTPAGKRGLDMRSFRACIYTGAVGPDLPWQLPAALDRHRRRWAAYERSELLSLALQAIFWAALDAMDESGIRLEDAEAVERWFPSHLASHTRVPGSFGAAVEATRKRLPSSDEWNNPEHEIQLCWELLDLADPDRTNLRNRTTDVARRILLALAGRDTGEDDPYEGLVFPPDYFAFYPINLHSLRAGCRGEWEDLTPDQWVGLLAGRWGVSAHLQVALRKLRHEKRDTFRVRPSDTGLVVVDATLPAETNPRFGNALRILRDLGAVDIQGEADTPVVTAFGHRMLKELRG